MGGGGRGWEGVGGDGRGMYSWGDQYQHSVHWSSDSSLQTICMLSSPDHLYAVYIASFLLLPRELVALTQLMQSSPQILLQMGITPDVITAEISKRDTSLKLKVLTSSHHPHLPSPTPPPITHTSSHHPHLPSPTPPPITHTHYTSNISEHVSR